MLTTLDHLPPGFLDVTSRDLYQILDGPTLIHLAGRRAEPLFVSILLHGNEDTGLKAMQNVLRRHAGKPLPRALSLFVGNVAAARAGVRRLDDQPDYNRIWPGAEACFPQEQAMMRDVVEAMRALKPFASIDIHNNTGLNPHYACINRLDHRYYRLATLFSRTVVHFTTPVGVQSGAFAELCPAVTVECGKAGLTASDEHAANYIDACLHLSEFPQHPLAPHDMDLFHTVATVKVAEGVRFGFGDLNGGGLDIAFEPALDHLNFREVAAGTRFGTVRLGVESPLAVFDDTDAPATGQFFSIENGALLLRRPLMPSMITLDTRVIEQDCLCYLMERMDW